MSLPDSGPEMPTEAPDAAPTTGPEAALAYLEALDEGDEIDVDVVEPEGGEEESENDNKKAAEKAKAKPDPEKETKSWKAYRRQKAAVKAEREAIRVDRQAFENEKAQRAAEVEQAKQDAAFLRDLRELSKHDQEAVLEKLGISYDDFTRSLLLKGTPEEKAGRTEAEVQRLRERLEAKEAEEQRAQQTAVTRKAEADILAYLKNPEVDEFKIARKVPPQRLVPLAHQAADLLRSAGQPVTDANVARVVVDHLNELRGELADESEDSPPAPAPKPGKTARAPSQTLTSRDTSTTSVKRPMTHEERLAYAASAFDDLPGSTETTPSAAEACIQTRESRGAQSPPDPHRAPMALGERSCPSVQSISRPRLKPSSACIPRRMRRKSSTSSPHFSA